MTTFQDAKDSFYIALRDRLAALNPDRTVVVRGATRPAVLVAENEGERASGAGVRDAFVLHWGAVSADASEALPLERARCEVRFATAGSAELAGMDRGRVLATMRAELESITAPHQAVKTGYDGAALRPARTPVFWSGEIEERSTETEGVVGCNVTLEVFAWREAA